jgi:hypothetical protein
MRRRGWLVLLAAGLVGVGGVAVYEWHELFGGQDTVSVLLTLTGHGSAQATVSFRPGRIADPAGFAERVAALLAPAAHRGPAQAYPDLIGRTQLVDVPLAGLPLPLRLDSGQLQRAAAEAGFRRLVVGLYSEDHYQVEPPAAARAGRCFASRSRIGSRNWVAFRCR